MASCSSRLQNGAPLAKKKNKKKKDEAPHACSTAPRRPAVLRPLVVPPPREPAPSSPLFCGAPSRPAFSSPRRRPLDPSSSRPRRRQAAAAARIEGGRILSEKDGAFWLQQRKCGGAGTCSWCSLTPTTSPCNADGLGDIRKEELYDACATLKILAEQVAVLDHQKLQDGFHEKWDHGLLAELTMEQIQLWDIDTIVTFDSYGVSGHPNHRDVHHGICKLLHENQRGNIEAWELVSLNMFRKYSGAVDIWLSSLISSSSKQLMYCLVNCSPSRTFEAMAAHRSQWVWFRRLFVSLSSYTYVNMLQKI